MIHYNMGIGAYGQDELHRAMMRSYGWMAGGLILTGAISGLLYYSGVFIRVLYNFPMLSLILAIAQIAIVMAISVTLYKSSEATMKVLFLLYAATLGVSLTSLAYVYDLGSITWAFVTTAVYFLCLVAIGTTTKKDMTRFGTICLGGLFALVITQLVMMLFGVGMESRLISIIGLLLFTGITVWDVQRLPQLLAQADSVMTLNKLTIFMALELYLDFINIFLYILRLLGSGRKN